MPAGGAYDTNIRAKSYHLPFVSPAGMWLAQAYNIIQIEFKRHTLRHYNILNVLDPYLSAFTTAL